MDGIDFEVLEKALLAAEAESAMPNSRQQKDELFAGVCYLQLCAVLESDASELIRLAKIGAAMEPHYKKDERLDLIVSHDWSDGCPLCGDSR